jgi:DHA2 family multidrug resistance protein
VVLHNRRCLQLYLVTMFRDSVRERLSELAAYFMRHGVSAAAAAQHKAIVALGNVVRRQSLIMAYADRFAVLGVLLLLAAGLLLFSRRAGASSATAH